MSTFRFFFAPLIWVITHLAHMLFPLWILALVFMLGVSVRFFSYRQSSSCITGRPDSVLFLLFKSCRKADRPILVSSVREAIVIGDRAYNGHRLSPGVKLFQLGLGDCCRKRHRGTARRNGSNLLSIPTAFSRSGLHLTEVGFRKHKSDFRVLRRRPFRRVYGQRSRS